MGTKPGVFVDGSQSTLIMASYLNDLRTLCYELAGDGTNAPATKAAARSNLGATAIGDALITAATAAAARGTLGSTVTGDALFVAATQAAARSVLGLVPGVDVQAYDADIPTVAASDAELIAGTSTSLRSMTPANVRAALGYASVTEYGSLYGTSISLGSFGTDVYCVDIFFYQLSTNGTNNILLGIGGTHALTIDSTCSGFSAAAVTTAQSSAGIIVANAVTAATAISGRVRLSRYDTSTPEWIFHAEGSCQRDGAAQMFKSHGEAVHAYNESRTLTMTTTGGTDQFDGGYIRKVIYNPPK